MDYHFIVISQVKELRWLPDALPPHCKFIITTTFTDLTYKSLTARTDVRTLMCPGLSDPSIHRSILLKHLSLPCKELPTNVFQRIMAKKLCHLPAFLAVLGTEMRSCGVQREKVEEIELLEEYIDVDSMPELWVKVILRWVKDCSGFTISNCKATSTKTNTASFTEGKYLKKIILTHEVSFTCRIILSSDLSGWVWDTLCLIHLSHAGLTEAEILTLLENLGYRGSLKVEVLEWARLRSAFWPWVQEKANGHLTIMHQSFSQAMNLLILGEVMFKLMFYNYYFKMFENVYIEQRNNSPTINRLLNSLTLITPFLFIGSRGQVKSQNDFHQILCDFFQKSSLQVCSWVRKMEEIPWHLVQMGCFEELHNFLSDPV